jgi:hypothetical protein
MQGEEGRFSDFLLLLSCLLLPVDVYVIGNWLGAGIQLALFRVQYAISRWSYISLFRDIEFIIRGILWGRAGAGILFWTAAATILVFASFFYVFHEDFQGSEGVLSRVQSRKFTGFLMMGSGVLFLLSLMIQYGPLFHGPSGFAIPVGSPLQLFAGYYFFRGSSDSGQTSGRETVPIREFLRSHLKSQRTIFALICFCALFATLNYVLYVYPDSGGDFSTYCAAVDVWNNQGNPYDSGSVFLSRLQFRSFGKPTLDSFLYPPATLPLFAPACGALQLVYPFRVYFPVYFLVFLMAYLVAGRFAPSEKDRLLLMTLLTAGFASLYWSFSTGNISILYLPLMSLTFYFFMKKRYYASSLCVTFMSIFSIFPILFSILYVFSDTSRRQKMKIVALSALVLGLFLAISSITFPLLFESYGKLLLGEGSPIFEGAGYKTPTAYLFFQNLAGLFLGNGTALPYVLDLCFAGTVLILFHSFYGKNRDDSPRLFSFGLLAIFLLIPRLKPNYFIFVAVPIYLLVFKERDMIKTLVITISAILPFICLVIADHMPLESMTGDLASLLIAYNQLLCALAIFILIAWLHVRKESDVKKFHP